MDEARLTLAVAAWLDTCRSPNTRAAYRTDLHDFAAWCRAAARDPLTPAAADLARYRDDLTDSGAGPATVARRLSAIASFGVFVTGGATPPVEVDRPAVAGASNAELLDDGEADALLAAADGSSERAGALIRLMMLDGLKVGEVVRADAADVSGRPPRMTLALRDPSARTIALHADTARAVHHYLARRRTGPLLLSETRGRTPGRLTRFGVDYLVKQTAEAAGIRRAVSGNTLRRRYVVAAHARGDEIDDIRRNAGHADARTTRRYLPAS